MMCVPEHWKYGTTRKFKFLPFVTPATLTDEVIRNGVILQNTFLLNIGAITVRYFNDADWKIPWTNKSFREVALTAGEELTPPRNLFQNLETATGYDKLYMLSYKENL